MLSHIRNQGLNLTRAASNVKLTAEKYKINRGEYSKLTDQHHQSLLSFVNGKGLSGVDQLDGYNTDWMNTVRGNEHPTDHQPSSLL